MNLPDYSEDVAGVEEPAAADLATMGVPSDAVSDLLHFLPIDDEGIDRIGEHLSPKPRTAWKGRALAAERDLAVARQSARFWRLVAYGAGIALLIGAAL